jgi:hypothetical protein
MLTRHQTTPGPRWANDLPQAKVYTGSCALGAGKGVLLMTGTGIVPPEDFSLQSGDEVQIQVGSALIENRVQENQS